MTKNKTKQIEEEEEEKLVLSRYVRHDWSDDDDERNAAEKPDDREERFFVGFDREVRRYLFHTHSSEVESNDVKFLYGVNTETRKLIKRSSRAGDLKTKFYIGEMSSMSTLEVAWEHKSLWPWSWDESSFCFRVAKTNKLELLKWAREEKKCTWNSRTINAAAEQGNLEMVKYCVANECHINELACVCAASEGHLECLKYLREEVKAPWDSRTASWAAGSGHLHILEYLVDRKYDEYDEEACAYAAENGHLDCLKYLHETAKAPWDEKAVREAHENNQTECLQYLLDNNCPLPLFWRYEGGVLRTFRTL